MHSLPLNRNRRQIFPTECRLPWSSDYVSSMGLYRKPKERCKMRCRIKSFLSVSCCKYLRRICSISTEMIVFFHSCYPSNWNIRKTCKCTVGRLPNHTNIFILLKYSFNFCACESSLTKSHSSKWKITVNKYCFCVCSHAVNRIFTKRMLSTSICVSIDWITWVYRISFSFLNAILGRRIP